MEMPIGIGSQRDIRFAGELRETDANVDDRGTIFLAEHSKPDILARLEIQNRVMLAGPCFRIGESGRKGMRGLPIGRHSAMKIAT